MGLGPFQCNQARIARDAALDGIYVLRTSLKPERLGAAENETHARGFQCAALVRRQVIHQGTLNYLPAVTDIGGANTVPFQFSFH